MRGEFQGRSRGAQWVGKEKRSQSQSLTGARTPISFSSRAYMRWKNGVRMRLKESPLALICTSDVGRAEVGVD